MSFFGDKDFMLEVAKGNVPGHSLAFGSSRNPSLGTNLEDIWLGGTLSSIPYDAQTGNFTAGLTITGGTSGATAIIVIDDDDGATGTLTIRKISGVFADGEVITDTSTGSADTNIPSGVISLGVYNYPSAGQQWEVVCESTNDAAAGTGARTIDVEYLDDALVLQTEAVTLNGHTPVLMVATNSFRNRVASVTSWGAGVGGLYNKANDGTIIIRDTVTKDVMMVINYDDNVVGDEHGNNVTRLGTFNTELGTKAYLIYNTYNTSKNHQADISALVRGTHDGGFFNSFDISVYQNSVTFDFSSTPLVILPTEDIRFIGKTNNTSVDVNVVSTWLIVEDDFA